MADETVQLDLAEGSLEFTPRQQHYFDAPYSVLFNRRFEEVMHQLAARDFRVLFVMLRFCDYGNNIHVARSELARRTGIAENHISSIIRKLERLGIISVIERGARYQISERYLWRGSAENYNRRRQETRNQLVETESMLSNDGTTTLATGDVNDNSNNGGVQEHTAPVAEEEAR